jgi:hypothetical protein
VKRLLLFAAVGAAVWWILKRYWPRVENDAHDHLREQDTLAVIGAAANNQTIAIRQTLPMATWGYLPGADAVITPWTPGFRDNTQFMPWVMN